MNQDEFETMAAKLGVRIAPKRVCSGFEKGRLVTIRYYPATCSKPAMRFACWYSAYAPRKLIRKRIRVPLELESQWSNEAEFLAILAGNAYCEWLSQSDLIPGFVDLVPGFVAVLSGVCFAYEGANDNESAVIVQWRDSRDI